MAIAQIRRKGDNILICNYLDADTHNEHWGGHQAVHHTISANTITQKVAVMEYLFTLGLVFATDDAVNTELRMDTFFYDVNEQEHFIYIDQFGESWFIECISEWPETEPKEFPGGREWVVKADFKAEGFIP